MGGVKWLCIVGLLDAGVADCFCALDCARLVLLLLLFAGLVFSPPDEEAPSEVPARLSRSSKRLLSFLPVWTV
jgi:hypothetical protein